MDAKTIIEKLGLPSTIIGYVGALTLFLTMSLITIDVISRYIFNSPITGVFEITEFMVLIIIFSFLAPTQANKNHVSVDLLVARLPKKLRFAIELINHVICLILMALITYMAFERALELMEDGEASPNLGVPEYPFVLFLVLGTSIMCIEYLRDIIRIVTKKEDDTP